MSIVMTGGGTGGHLAIVRAVKESIIQFNTKNSATPQLIYIGSTKGQDKKWFEADNDFAYKYFIESQGVVNQGVFGKMNALFKIAISAWKVRKLLKTHNARVVFSVGGFSAAPAALAAKLCGVPLVIHEQNAKIGLLNRLLKPYATKFISSYLKESPIQAYPVNQIFFKNARIRTHIKTVIFLGGSQGAKAINELALSLAESLTGRGISIIHQAGESHVDSVKNQYKQMGIEAEVFGFTDQMASLMQKADFAIARAGASTLWELAATALPTLYIPYPYAAGDHQFYNAKFLVDKGLAWIMREDTLLAEGVLVLLDEEIESKSKGLLECVKKDGSNQIAKLLISYDNNHHCPY